MHDLTKNLHIPGRSKIAVTLHWSTDRRERERNMFMGNTGRPGCRSAPENSHLEIRN